MFILIVNCLTEAQVLCLTPVQRKHFGNVQRDVSPVGGTAVRSLLYTCRQQQRSVRRASEVHGFMIHAASRPAQVVLNVVLQLRHLRLGHARSGGEEGALLLQIHLDKDRDSAEKCFWE